MDGYSKAEKAVLTRLQHGVDPVARPFRGLPMAEREVLALLVRTQADGLVRRFGAVFDARRLGYRSILCALECPPGILETQADIIASHSGVTHCYERRPLIGSADYPALWFTLAMLHDVFDEGLAVLRSQLGALPSAEAMHASCLFEFPALRRFKIDVVFDLRTVDRDETFPGATPAPERGDGESFRVFTDQERALVRALDQQIPAVERPFAVIADRLGMREEDVLSRLQAWTREGVLRRIAVVLNHHEAGFKANAMCVWPVEGDVLAAGRRVAQRTEVTHCYQRPRATRFPFDLYAMIHTPSWPQTRALFDDIAADCKLTGGELFASGREFKKSSMHYFT
jgi:DNA-binding Lrp family transcriptional regulator